MTDEKSGERRSSPTSPRSDTGASVDSAITDQPFVEPAELAGEAVDVPVAADPAGEPLLALPGGSSSDADLTRLHAVPVELAVEIGRTKMTIGDALALGPGSIITLHRMAGEPVDLLVNGRPIARGEVVVIDEEFGLRVTEVVAAPVVDGSVG
jgi:flagellar motor switch protein FliN/FliY